MANECTFSALVTGRVENVREFLKIMQKHWAYGVLCEDEPQIEDFAPDAIISEHVEGYCRWSVLCAMRSEYRNPSIESESKRLNLFVEFYSTEPGCAFQEHVFIKKGAVCIDDCVDYEEIYVGDYNSIEEFNAANDTTFTQDIVEDDYIITGGFGWEYGSFHSIDDFKEDDLDSRFHYEHLPLYATHIEWDVDDLETSTPTGLPTEMRLPEHLREKFLSSELTGEYAAICDDISDYITCITGYCHNGFELEFKPYPVKENQK